MRTSDRHEFYERRTMAERAALLLAALVACATAGSPSSAAETVSWDASVLPPLPAMPQPWDSKMQAMVPSKSYLPPALTGAPRLADAGRQHRLRLRPAADWASLPWSDLPSRLTWDDLPSRAALAPSQPPACTASPDFTRLVRPWRETGPDPSRSDTTTDPAQDHTARMTMAKVPELRQKAAPYLRLAIPDPLELSTVIHLQKQPPDNDAPAAVTDSPPRPVLPTQPPPAPKPQPQPQPKK